MADEAHPLRRRRSWGGGGDPGEHLRSTTHYTVEWGQEEEETESCRDIDGDLTVGRAHCSLGDEEQEVD